MRAVVVFGCAALASAQSLPPVASTQVDYVRDVQPILSQKCYSCHGLQVQQAGLRLDRRQPAMRGGDYGPVINPGKSAESKLIRKLVTGDGGLVMPPSGKLDDDEISILRAWIDQGAEFRLEIKEAPAKPADPQLASLITSVRSNDAQAVRKLLAANPRLINASDASGSTPLHHAAGFSNLSMLKLLLDDGADVNAANRRKATPLFWAIADAAKVGLLIERGADVNARTVEGRTPVYQAAVIGKGVPTLRILLAKGASPDTKTLPGSTPLMMAAGRGNVAAMRLLLEKGADVNARSGSGATPLMAAASDGSVEAVQLLASNGADVKLKTKRGETALAFAATSGNEAIVNLLIARGADINARDSRGYSPLVYAAGSDAVPAGVVKALLARGADVNARGDDETAAMLAAKRGDTEVARLLGVTAVGQKTLGALEQRDKRTIGEAVGPALDLLARQSETFIRVGGCNSCHAQDLPSAAAALARQRGLPAPKSIPQLPAHMENDSSERLMEFSTVGTSGLGVAWQLFDLGMNGAARSQYTDATVYYLRAMQQPGGDWDAPDGRRPPMIFGKMQPAALAIYGIQHFGRAEDREVNTQSVARAVAYLEAARPQGTHDRAYRLLGLAWGKAKPSVMAAAKAELAASQRQDGGWSQLPTMSSDAHATGAALFALHVGGRMPTADAVYQRGTNYLLSTQAADGSWHVKSRSIWVQPYFESGFPYGHDQWISAAGTAWATMALSLTVPAPELRSSSR
ncbi:MAG TPA: ankyrin repeat domain-containing protein [Bryobacteraceae bacterium]|nr:ankyrin repeat domain-containing protein [Bryobacteraceae bacterium]